MDEPVDLEEHEEPNPIQDEAESDKAHLCKRASFEFLFCFLKNDGCNGML